MPIWLVALGFHTAGWRTAGQIPRFHVAAPQAARDRCPPAPRRRHCLRPAAPARARPAVTRRQPVLCTLTYTDLAQHKRNMHTTAQRTTCPCKRSPWKCEDPYCVAKYRKDMFRLGSRDSHRRTSRTLGPLSMTAMVTATTAHAHKTRPTACRSLALHRDTRACSILVVS